MYRVEVWNNTYPILEDTIQTIKAIDRHIHELVIKYLDKQLNIIDVGSGSGVLTIHTVYALRWRVMFRIVSTDVDFNACRNTLHNLKLNGIEHYVDVICTSTCLCLRSSLKVSAVISNPPYLPENDVHNHRVTAGPDGRLVLDELLREISRLRPYMIILTQSSLSNLEKTIKTLRDLGYIIIDLLREHYFFEDIYTIIAVLN